MASAVWVVPSPVQGATTLAAAAAQSGRYFGAAIAAHELADGQYSGILDREFGSVTPENEMKWDFTEPSRGIFTFDRVVNETHDVNTLRDVMKNHINVLMGRYRGQIHSWDVVNEAFADGGSGEMRGSVFRDVLGPGFIEAAAAVGRRWRVEPAVRLPLLRWSLDGGHQPRRTGACRQRPVTAHQPLAVAVRVPGHGSQRERRLHPVALADGPAHPDQLCLLTFVFKKAP
ncbi:endo-1,4-beta-xylanase [Lentzea flava]|uniref:endo-1,4-beta-xylanase n=1 Tax=Lentzea flava TaxID=103732 RepID=UPI003F809BA9